MYSARMDRDAERRDRNIGFGGGSGRPRDFGNREFGSRDFAGMPRPEPAFNREQGGPRHIAPTHNAAPPAEQPAVPAEPSIDREKICPLLLRVFPKIGDHHRLEEYQVRGQEPGTEVQMYTWPDATLRELTDLVKEVQPAARASRARLMFALVYPDRRGRNIMRPIGQVHSLRAGPDDNKTLKALSFQTGDFLDVAIIM